MYVFAPIAFVVPQASKEVACSDAVKSVATVATIESSLDVIKTPATMPFWVIYSLSRSSIAAFYYLDFFSAFLRSHPNP